MGRSRFSDEHIVGILKEHQAGLSSLVRDVSWDLTPPILSLQPFPKRFWISSGPRPKVSTST